MKQVNYDYLNKRNEKIKRIQFEIKDSFNNFIDSKNEPEAREEYELTLKLLEVVSRNTKKRVSCLIDKVEKSSNCDDAFNPPTVQIGNQLWMTENLKYDDGGYGITHSPDNDEYYYNWDAAMRVAKKLGWKLPSIEDWNKAAEECGDVCINSKYDGIIVKDYEGNKLYDRLTVKLVGVYCGSLGNVGCYAYFCTSSEYSYSDSSIYYIRFSTRNSMDSNNFNKYAQFSVRLVKEM